jgi:transcriptional regulator with XRE-family HTH domain
MPSQLHDVSADPNSFAGRLRSLMEAQRVSAEKLSRLSRVNVRMINRYRAGKNEPRDSWGDPTANALKLARALGVEVDELLPPRERQAA